MRLTLDAVLSWRNARTVRIRKPTILAAMPSACTHTSATSSLRLSGLASAARALDPRSIDTSSASPARIQPRLYATLADCTAQDCNSSAAAASTALRVDAEVDLREDVVHRLQRRQPLLVDLAALDRVGKKVEAGEVVADAPLRVLDGGARLHDERPVGGLRQQQRARRLI